MKETFLSLEGIAGFFQERQTCNREFNIRPCYILFDSGASWAHLVSPPITASIVSIPSTADLNVTPACCRTSRFISYVMLNVAASEQMAASGWTPDRRACSITIHLLYLEMIHLLICDIICSIDIPYWAGHPINCCSQEITSWCVHDTHKPKLMF